MILKDDNYYSVGGWVPLRLGIKNPVEQIIFGIIYGFSQDGKSVFTGSTEYLAEWFNMSRSNIIVHLNNLIDTGFIIKEYTKNSSGRHVCYIANLELINKYRDLKENVTEKQENFNNNVDKEKPANTIKVSKQEKIINDCIDKFSFHKDIEDLLYQYYMSLVPIKKFPSSESIMLQLGDLDLLNDNIDAQKEIITETFKKSWGSLDFMFKEYLKRNNLTLDQLGQDNYYKIQFRNVSDEAIKNYPKDLIESYLKDPKIPQDIKNRIISLTSQNNSIDNYENKSY